MDHGKPESQYDDHGELEPILMIRHYFALTMCSMVVMVEDYIGHEFDAVSHLLAWVDFQSVPLLPPGHSSRLNHGNYE